MRLLYYVIFLIFPVAICSFTDGSPEMKKISNQLYSFSIPKDWECGLRGNVRYCEPVERHERELYHLYYLHWKSPGSRGVRPNMYIIIQTFQRLDGTQVTIEEIESMIMDNNKQNALMFELNIFDIKYINGNANQKRFIINSEGMEISINGSQKFNSMKIYLLHKSKDKVHQVGIYVLGDLYPFPEIQQLVNDILDSFVAN